jgi:hemolysin III
VVEITARSREEVLNATTHAVGVVASIAGGAALIVRASQRGDARLIIGVSVFAATLVVLYTASTFYHFVRHPDFKRRLKIFDHAAIYALIAGSYTPFTLAGMRGAWGWSLFGVTWGLAVAGIVFKLFYAGRFRGVSTLIYIGMGWLAVIAAGPLMRALQMTTLAWLVAGGVTYTLGTLFYLSRRTYAHAIWHMFVLAGSVCHAIAVGTL